MVAMFNDSKHNRHLHSKFANSCILIFILVYDFAFCQFILTIFYVAAWIGTWQNLDTFSDEIIFQENLVHSTVASLVIGFCVSTSIVVLQLQIQQFAKSGGL